MKFLTFLLLIFLCAESSLAQNPPVIVSSINPIHQIVLAITQNKNNSILIVDRNVSEHDYQFKPADIEAISKADLIFYVDDNLEKNFTKLVRKKPAFQLSKVPDMKILPGRKNPKKTDLHLWLNPQNAVQIAEFVTKKVCTIDVSGCGQYQKNLDKFKKDEIEISKTIRKKLSGLAGKKYVFYYDSYQYFENYFSLKSVGVVVNDHDYGLTIRELRDFSALVEKEGGITCLLSDKFDEKNSAQKLAKNYQIKLVLLDLMGDEGGYFKMMNDLADAALSCGE